MALWAKTYLLVFWRQKTYCVEIEATEILALHSLIAIALCRMDHMKTTSLLEWVNPTLVSSKLVIPQEVALTFVLYPRHPSYSIANIVSLKFGDVVKEIEPFHLSLVVIVLGPPKSCHFTIEEGDLLFLLASSSTDDFDLKEKTNHLFGRVLPFAKTSGVGARHEKFKRERHREVVVVHT